MIDEKTAGNAVRSQLLAAIALMVPEEPAPAADPLFPAEWKAENAGKPVALVVEDNSDSMVTLKALLRDEFTVIEAHDGHEGVSAAIRHLPDLILMDISLPGKDGIAAFMQIRNSRETSSIPVIVVTASAMEEERTAIMAHGFDAFITKPIDAAKLQECIRGVLYGT